MSERALSAGLLVGAVLAGLGLLGALLSDGPYLAAASLSPWIVLWALGLLAVLLLAPFALHRRAFSGTDDRDRRWELAVVAWGAIALVALLAFGALAVAAGFGTGSALGAVALVGLVESGLVVGAVLAILLAGG